MDGPVRYEAEGYMRQIQSIESITLNAELKRELPIHI
jgi:hypothetical protein